MTHEFFHSLVETDNIAGSVWAPARSSLVLSSGSFPLVSFLSCMLWLVHNWIFKGTRCRFPKFSLCADIPFYLSPWAFISVTFSSGTLLGPSPPFMAACRLPQGSKPGNCITYLICVTSFRDHCPSLPDIQCLTNCCFIFFFLVYLVVLGGRIYLVPVTPSGLKPK